MENNSSKIDSLDAFDIKTKTNKKLRKSNFELLRIISMIMIISGHYVAHGVFKVSSSEAYVMYLQGIYLEKVCWISRPFVCHFDIFYCRFDFSFVCFS